MQSTSSFWLSYIMNDWVLAAIAIAMILAALHYASKLLTRVTGRSMGGMGNLRSFTASLALMLGGMTLVSAVVPLSRPLKYVAYAIVMGIAGLVSRLLFGSRESTVSESTSSHDTSVVSDPSATPNPSIEGTTSGLRSPAAPHVKR